MVVRLIDIWADWMWNCTWQVLILIALVWCIDRACRNRLWPHIFFCLWATVLLKLLLPPFLGSPVSLTQSLLGNNGGPWFLDGTFDEYRALVGEHSLWLKAAFFVVWCIGVIGLALFYAIRYRQMRQRATDCREPSDRLQALANSLAEDMQIRGKWRLRVCHQLQMPGLFGIRRPTILLPADLAESADDDQLRSVLAHEFAHIRRGDAAFRLVTHAVLIWYWFNPALIVLRRRLAQLQEICCDATAMSYLQHGRSSYINTLVTMGRRMLHRDSGPLPAPTLLSVFDTSSGLSERMQRLLHQPRKLSSQQRKLIGVVVLLIFKLTIFPMGDPNMLFDDWSGGLP